MNLLTESSADTNNENIKTKLIAFTFPRIFSSLVLGIVGFALFFLYNLAYNVNSVLVGIGVGIGYFSVAAGQFLLGWLSDGKYTKLGRRKPFILIFMPLNAIAFIFLLLPNLLLSNPSELTLFIWLIIWDAIFQFSYAYTTVYQSWMPEQFTTEERPKVSQVQNIFNMIGQGAQLVFTFLVLTDARDRIVANPGFIPFDFLLIVFIFSGLLIFFYLISTKIMPIEPHHEINSDYIHHLKVILKHKNFLSVTFMQGLASFAWIMMTNVMLNYIEVVLNFGTAEYLIAAVILLFGVIGFLALWRRLIEKRGKKNTLLSLFLFAMLFLPISLVGIIPLTPPGSTIFGFIFIIGIAFIFAGWSLFPYIMYADLAEDTEKKEGELMAGIYIGFPSIPLNIFQAFGSILLGLILALPALGTATYSFGYVIWGVIASGFLIIAFLFSRKFIKLDFEWQK